MGCAQSPTVDGKAPTTKETTTEDLEGTWVRCDLCPCPMCSLAWLELTGVDVLEAHVCIAWGILTCCLPCCPRDDPSPLRRCDKHTRQDHPWFFEGCNEITCYPVGPCWAMRSTGKFYGCPTCACGFMPRCVFFTRPSTQEHEQPPEQRQMEIGLPAGNELPTVVVVFIGLSTKEHERTPEQLQMEIAAPAGNERPTEAVTEAPTGPNPPENSNFEENPNFEVWDLFETPTGPKPPENSNLKDGSNSNAPNNNVEENDTAPLQRAVAWPLPAEVPVAVAVAMAPMQTTTDKLVELKNMLDKGLITDDDYEKKKAQLLEAWVYADDTSL